MRKLWFFLRPNCIKLFLLVVLALASLAVTTRFEATSKVTWYADRGFPFPFLTISESVDRKWCEHNTICIDENIQDFYPNALVLDILGWYLISCIVTTGYETVKSQRKAS